MILYRSAERATDTLHSEVKDATTPSHRRRDDLSIQDRPFDDGDVARALRIIEILQMARGEIIKDRDRMASGNELVDQMAADESCAARN
jgi:hypothetical protein